MIAVPIAVPFNTAFVITGVVKILFVKVSTVSCNTTVPVALGKVIVLSAVGSVTVNVVSWSSAVAPSNTIDVLIFKAVAVTELMIFHYFLEYPLWMVLKMEQSLKKIYHTQENLKKPVLILSTVLQGVSEAHLF